MLFTTVVVVSAFAAVWLLCKAVSVFIKPLILIAFGFVTGAIGAHLEPQALTLQAAALGTFRAADNWAQVIATTALAEGSPIRETFLGISANRLSETERGETNLLERALRSTLQKAQGESSNPISSKTISSNPSGGRQGGSET